mmetsp:Transcript_6579/g.10369  ORF Transcript_6579/g.10369 Transcript_6579/m.10369 type:complete len:251 (+) Transcript_6579:110-862(+)
MGESNKSFSEMMQNYENQQSGSEGASTGSSSGFGFALPDSLQSSFGGIGSSFKSGLQTIGQNSYVQGTPLQGIGTDGGDIESGAGGGDSAMSFGTLSRSERFKGFVGLLLLSGFFFVLSFFFVGVIVLFPAKFAFPFSMGSIFFMSAFALIQGPMNWAKKVFSRAQLPFTLMYFGSIIGTLYSCLVARSYLLVIIFSLVQLCALGYYAFGNMPGGQYGLKLVTAFIKQLLRNVCWPCMKGVGKLFGSFFS